MTDIQAAIGRVQMQKLSSILADRRQIAEIYSHALQDVDPITLPTFSSQHTWQTYMVVLEPMFNRRQIINALRQLGISTGPGAVAGTQSHIFQHHFPELLDDYPVSAHLHRQGLALPLYGQMPHEWAVQTAEALCRVLGDQS